MLLEFQMEICELFILKDTNCVTQNSVCVNCDVDKMACVELSVTCDVDKIACVDLSVTCDSAKMACV